MDRGTGPDGSNIDDHCIRPASGAGLAESFCSGHFLAMYSLFATGIGLWFVYGVLIESTPIMQPMP